MLKEMIYNTCNFYNRRIYYFYKEGDYMDIVLTVYLIWCGMCFLLMGAAKLAETFNW